MKKIIGLALVAGCLAAMPVMAQAAGISCGGYRDKVRVCEWTHGLQKG